MPDIPKILEKTVPHKTFITTPKRMPNRIVYLYFIFNTSKFKFVYIFSEHRILPHKTHVPKKASLYGCRRILCALFYKNIT